MEWHLTAEFAHSPSFGKQRFWNFAEAQTSSPVPGK
jgi:hypothetical protein